MRRLEKRIISLMLIAVLMVNLTPVQVWANDADQFDASNVEAAASVAEPATQERQEVAPEDGTAALETQETAVPEQPAVPEQSQEPTVSDVADSTTVSSGDAASDTDEPQPSGESAGQEDESSLEETDASTQEEPQEPVNPEETSDSQEQEPLLTLQEQINDLVASGGTGRIVLNRNYEENFTVPAGINLTLDLNGNTLSPVRPERSTDPLTMISVSGKLTLQDSVGGGRISNIHNDSDTRGIYVSDTGEVTLERGVISGFHVKKGNGGAIYVSEHGKLTVKGGSITGNSAVKGGGVFAVSADSLHIQEGTVFGNTATETGTEDICPTPALEETAAEPAAEAESAVQEPITIEEHELQEIEASEDALLEEDALSEETLTILQAPLRGPLRTAPSMQEPVTLDGVTIEKITVRWLSKSTGESTPAGFNTLALKTDSDKVGNQQFQIDFALSGKDDHEAGSVELVFPAYLWKDRYGNEPGNLTLSVPADPETGADFAWKRVGDNIIITNVRKISAATKVMIQGTFRNVTPHEMVDIDVTDGSPYAGAANKGHSNDFTATINLTTADDNTISMTSNAIDATIDTHVEAASATKSAYNTSRREYYIYHTPEKAKAAGIPQEFLDKLGEEADKYSFACWYVSGSATGSQPFTLTVTDTFDGTVVHYLDALHQQKQILNVRGRMLGVQGAMNGENVVSEDGRTVTATLYDGYNTYPKSAYVWTAYLKSDFPVEGDEYDITNTQTISATGWDDQITTTKESTAGAPFRLPVTYTVKKVWHDEGHEDRRPDHQSFGRYYSRGNSTTLETIRVNADNNWTYSWDDEGRGWDYKVREYGMDKNGRDITGWGYFMNVGDEEYSHIINPVYDEDGDLKEYDRWWYSLEKEEYDSENHTWIKYNKYNEEHVVRNLIPFREQKLQVGIRKYRLGYGDSNLMSSNDRALNILRRGDDVVVDYNVYGYGYIMELTKNENVSGVNVTDFGFRDVRLELEDNYGEDTLKSIKDNTLLLDSAIRLTPDDAEIAYVTLKTPKYLQFTQTDKYSPWYYRELGGADFGDFDRPDEELWGLQNGQWVRFAVVSVSGNGTVSVKAENEARSNGMRVTLPPGVWKVKTAMTVPGLKDAGDISRRIDGVRMEYDIGIRLLGESETIQNRLNALFDANDYAMCTLDNFATINAFEQGGDLAISLDDHARSYLHGRNHRVAVRAEKSFTLVENDIIARQLKLHSSVTVTQQSNVLTSGEYYAAIQEGIIPSTESGTWYDLLPVGVKPDVSTVRLGSGDKILDVYTVENYKDSGRILLIVKADVAQHVSYTNYYDYNPYRSDDTYPKEGYKNVQTLEFDAYYAWDMARIYGLDTARNVAAYEADEEKLGNIAGWAGEPDDPQKNHNQRAMDAVGDDKVLMTDLDPARPAGHTAFVYAGAVLKHEEVDFNAETQLKKFVTRDGLGSWSTGLDGAVQVTVNEGGYYTYMLYVASDSDTTTRDMILLDPLENYVPTMDDGVDYQDGQWHGSFVSLDLSQLEAYGVKPVVYYSTEALNVSGANGYGSTEDIEQKLKTSGQWSTTPPADLSRVRAIAIDARHKTDGSSFELEPDQSFYVTVRMHAPVYETAGEETDPFAKDSEERKNPENNDHAYNNIYLNCTQIDPLGQQTEAYIEHHYVRVGIVPYELTVSKVWDDADNNDGIRPKAVIVKLLGNDKDTGKSMELNADNNWTGVFGHLQQYDENGNWITYSFAEQAVDNDPTGNLTGYTASFNRQGDFITITNTHVPETTEIRFTKAWKNDDEPEARALRPESIEVRLMADGVFTGKTVTVRPDRDGNWAGSFTDLPKYKNATGLSGDAKMIEYSVQEVPVYKYNDAYGSENGIITITNTFYPFGDLKVSKTVENVTDESKDKEFTFTLMLKDSEGGDLTEKYNYVIYNKAENGEGTEVKKGTIGNGDSFKLKGGQYLMVKDIPSESTYEVAEENLPGFTLSGYSGTSGTIRAGATQIASFTNHYDATGSQEISLKKYLTGRTMSRYQFRFELVDITEGSVTKDAVIRTASADASGNAIFGRINYTQKDHGKTFTYQIREVDREKPGYTYDTTVYTVTVTVKDNGDGTMTCIPRYLKANGDEISSENVTFTNKYEASGSITLKAWKQLPGGELTDYDPFSFELLTEDRNPESATYGEFKVCQERITSNDVGTITFNALNFTEKDAGNTYLYVAREVAGGDARINYDTSLKGYELVVVDNGNGTLAITQNNVTVEPDGNGGYRKTGETTDLPIFVNTLKPGDLSVTKKTTWEGKEPDGNMSFPFSLTLVGDELPETITVQLSEVPNKAYSAGNEPTPLTENEKKEKEVELLLVSPENTTPATGVYEFTLKAGQKLTVKDLPAGVAYQFQEKIPSGWTLVFENVAGVVKPNATASATYTNTYEPGSTVVTVLATKRLDGQMPPGQKFAFELVDDNEGPDKGNVIETLWNHPSGYVLFELKYTEEGSYHYLIREVPKIIASVSSEGVITYSTDEDELRRIEFDEKTYGVTVNVTKTEVDGNVTLNANLVYDENNGAPPQFENKTRPGSLQITKVGEGLTEANKDAEFTFKVRLSNPAGMPLTEAGNMFWYAEGEPAAGDVEETPVMEDGDMPAYAGPQTAQTPAADGEDTQTPAPAPARRMMKASAAKAPAAGGTLLGAPLAENDYGKVLQTGTFGGSGMVVNGVKQGSVKYTVYDSGYTIMEPTNGVSGSFNSSGINAIGGSFYYSKYFIVKGTCYANGNINHLFCAGSGTNLVYADLRGIDVSNVRSLQEFWDWTAKLEYLDISTWNLPTASYGYLLYKSNLKIVKLGPGFYSNNTSFFRSSGYFTCLEKPQLGQKTLASFCNGKKLGDTYAGTWVKVGYNPNYTIAFDPNGATGTMDSISANLANPPTLPPCTFESDLNFAGWSTDPIAIVPEYADGAQYTSGAYGGQTVTLYAIWMSEDSFLLHYDANGGYSRVQWQRVNGPADTVAMPTPTHPNNYEFLGWNTAADGSGTYYSGEVTGADFHAEPGSTVTLYAQFLDPSKRATLTVKHYQQNASRTGYDGPVAIDRTVHDLLPSPETVEAATHEYTGFRQPAIQTVTVNKNTTVEYYYDRTEYSLAFNANGGEGTMATRTMTGGVASKLPVCTFTKENALFVGWNTAADGSGTNYGDGQSVNTIAGDRETLTLYAQWFSLDGAQQAEATNGEYTVTCHAGQTIVFPSVPAGTLYEVVETNLPDGWTLQGIENGTGTVLSAERVNVTATNQYSSSGSASLMAHKSITGENIQAGQFSFQLCDREGNVLETVSNASADQAEEIINDQDEIVPNPWYGTGPIRFSTITYNNQGVYHYTIREIAGGDSAIRYDSHEEQVTVLVTDQGDGRLKTQVFYDADEANFINAMSSGDLTVSKTLRNATAVAAESEFAFTVYLYDRNGTEIKDTFPVKMPDGSEATITSGGYVTIKGGQSFTVTGLPHKSSYVVVETPAPGFEQVVADNTHGTIEAGQTSQVHFENAYSISGSGGGGAVIEAEKRFLGGDIETDQFKFRLTDSQGELIEEVSAQEDGSVMFSALHYTLDDDGKRFVYYIEEIPGEAEDIVFDNHKERVAVTVADHGDGTLATEVNYDEDGAVFTNVKMFQLVVEKTVTGDKKYYNGEKFGFTITLAQNGKPYVIADTPEGAADWQEVSEGTYTFRLADKDSFLLTLPENVEYTVREQAPEGYSVSSAVTGSTGETAASGEAEITGTILRQYDSEHLLFINEKLIHYDITLKKVDANTDEPLANAVFNLYGADYFNEDQTVNDAATPITVGITTDKTGQADLGSLFAGTYYLVETEAPADYVRLEDPILLVVSEEGVSLNGILSKPEDKDSRTVVVTVANEYLYGSLEIVKGLPVFEDSEAATFVFDVYAELDGETVYSNVAVLTFTTPGEKTVLLDRIPDGTKVTVTEVYSGAHYTAAVPARTTTIEAGNVSSVRFTNDYDGSPNGGHGIVNNFVYESEKGWQWNKLDSNG